MNPSLTVSLVENHPIRLDAFNSPICIEEKSGSCILFFKKMITNRRTDTASSQKFPRIGVKTATRHTPL
ncbi:hypothetical protein WN48_10798 [Eufriesea mexicana]|uniref:Uncharacterized protein n=1 Tax=Eufriesea mexicana TaxID=516756 RepID=A0A310SGL3_9HYME|nr:hypothetical protein WN48_10798 [Eufriesea mexicana]